MTDKLKQALVSEEATIIWRISIFLLISLFCWTAQQQINRIDTHDKQIQALEECIRAEFVTKDELNEMKNDVKNIEKTLSIEMPKMSYFMGQATEFMKANSQ